MRREREGVFDYLSSLSGSNRAKVLGFDCNSGFPKEEENHILSTLDSNFSAPARGHWSPAVDESLDEVDLRQRLNGLQRAVMEKPGHYRTSRASARMYLAPGIGTNDIPSDMQRGDGARFFPALPWVTSGRDVSTIPGTFSVSSSQRSVEYSSPDGHNVILKINRPP